MRSVRTDPELDHLDRWIYQYARDELGMTLPDVRFFILDPIEFAALLEKNVYPTSPANIWEGKRMIQKKHRIAEGLESALYYEVVQTGNPSYAYLNETNSTLTQASVMAHVLGHCEFSERNVLMDTDTDRSEYVMFLSRKVELARQQMGEQRYIDYWNACESMIPLISPNSQYNLERSIELEHRRSKREQEEVEPAPGEQRKLFNPYSSTLGSLFTGDPLQPIEAAERQRQKAENLSLRGYRLRAPCQDITGFLREHAPASKAERAILDYFYVSHMHQDFVMRTQIMNEGWAMYWEKKIMLKLFEEGLVKGVIDYSRVFSGVCYPRPWYQRNPYHLGFHMWEHIEDAYRTGKLSLEYREEPMRDVKDQWNRPPAGMDAWGYMRHLVNTITDYEFLRRYLTPELVEQFHLNRVPRQQAPQLGIRDEDVIRSDERWVWLDPDPIPGQMLDFFTHFYRPRIYVVDNDFLDGGLLLFHRDDGRALRQDWIRPTLHNINRVWKAPVYLLTQGNLHGYRAGKYEQQQVANLEFDDVVQRMRTEQKAFRLS